MQSAWGYTGTLILDAALRAGIFDLLDKGPKTAAEIVAATGNSQRGVTSILNALVGLQFLKREGERYSLAADTAEFLVSTKPAFHGALLNHLVDQLLPKWMQLRRVVRTGKPAMTVNSQQEGAAFFAAFVESLFPLSYGGFGVRQLSPQICQCAIRFRQHRMVRVIARRLSRTGAVSVST